MNLLISSSKSTILFNSKMLTEYLPPTENRYHHILGVVRCMENLLPRRNIQEEEKAQLLQACFLHDIGYSQKLNQYYFHPLDGAIFAQKKGFPKPVIAAILFHSCAYETVQVDRIDLKPIYEENLRGLDEQDQRFIDLVTYCDLHTSPTGQAVSLEERVQEVVERYGEQHPVSERMLENVPNYEQVIERVNQQII